MGEVGGLSYCAQLAHNICHGNPTLWVAVRCEEVNILSQVFYCLLSSIATDSQEPPMPQVPR